MAKNLVIVESPAKGKTISRFLGSEYKVLASMGHVRDLPKSDIGIDIKNNFEPTYEISADKKTVISGLKKELKDADTLWIATDEDREGEAIGWHLLEALNVPKAKKIERIVFHEITEKAIKEAIAHPRSIDQNIVDAQQARRVLDRLVGYELSPLLWKKVKYGLSAGRVQSVAVRMVVDKEREIEAFKSEEYWKVTAVFGKQGLKKGEVEFTAELSKFDGKKFVCDSEKKIKEVLAVLDGANYSITGVEEKEVTRNPSSPFITSTLQQEASRKLNFSVKKTMMVAQQLYEGIDVGAGETGLITYMRTDSVNLAESALVQAKEIISKRYGKEYALDTPRKFKGRKGAQEAHEAIRPVDLSLVPEQIEEFLNSDQFRLYELIWKRTIACQMAEAKLLQTGIDIEAEKTGYVFRATGQVIKFPGFMEVYMEGKDHEEEEEDNGDRILPKMSEGENVDLNKITPTQHFTKPPARYTEASLVKKMESEGIGRPSTYAPTIHTIITRGYILKDGRVLRPTDLAMIVTDLLVEHFSDIVDYQFTAEMEDKLDEVEEGNIKWVPMIKEFYEPFHENLLKKEGEIKKEDVFKERVLGKDKKTGLDIVARYGRFGPYVQVGAWTKEEVEAMEEKPHRASLSENLYFETVTLEEAEKLLLIPRTLGKTKDGESVVVMVGRFGPYLKVGEKKNVTLPVDYDPYEVSLDEALKVIAEEKKIEKKQNTPISELGKDPVSGGEILVKDGRFGPYITDGKTNVSIRKDTSPEEITFEIAVEMLDKKRKAPKRKFVRRGKK